MLIRIKKSKSICDAFNTRKNIMEIIKFKSHNNLRKSYTILDSDNSSIKTCYLFITISIFFFIVITFYL